MFFDTYAKVEASLRKATGEDDVSIVAGGDHADLASTVAFSLAKKRKMNPAALAAEISSEITVELEKEGIAVEVKSLYRAYECQPQWPPACGPYTQLGDRRYAIKGS